MLTEIDDKALTSALGVAARLRKDEHLSVKDLLKDLRWLHKAVAEYEVGSKIGLKPTPRGGFTLDDSDAKRINRAENLAQGDMIAVGPTIRPKTFMNAHGRVVSIRRDNVTVELDAGDRGRIERATGKKVAERTKFPLVCVEKTE